jgi:hypothetical protein
VIVLVPTKMPVEESSISVVQRKWSELGGSLTLTCVALVSATAAG